MIDLVQGYDECVMSYSESKDVLRSPGSGTANHTDIAYLHAILLNGQVIGHWKHALKGREVIVETFFYRPLDKARTDPAPAHLLTRPRRPGAAGNSLPGPYWMPGPVVRPSVVWRRMPRFFRSASQRRA